MQTHIRGARILTPFQQREGVVVVDGETIADVTEHVDAGEGDLVIDGRGMYLTPGFIDLRVHGDGRRDVMEGTAEAVIALCNAHAAQGATTLLPATLPAPMPALKRAVDAVRRAQAEPCDATIAGVHLQGLFWSPAWTDAKDGPHLLTPDEAGWQGLLEGWDCLRIVGAAPELPGALALGDVLRDRGIVASISHADAAYEQVLQAIAHGYSDVTGLYMTSSSLTARSGVRVPGVTECGLVMDELTVQLSADVSRIPLLALQLIFRCKGAEGILLATGADDHAGLSPAGDAFPTMAELVRNMVAAGATLRAALRMATVNPARRIGLEGSKGRVAAGYDADLLLLDSALNVRLAMAKGRVLFENLGKPEATA